MQEHCTTCPASLSCPYAHSSLYLPLLPSFPAIPFLSHPSPLSSSTCHHQLESSFLSNEATREKLPAVLACVRDKLNSCGFCTISIGDYCWNTWYVYVHKLCFSHSPFLPFSLSPFSLPPSFLPSFSLPPFLPSWHIPSLSLLPPDDTNRLHLKITPSLQDPPEVMDYQVPIFTCTREDIVNTSWDLTIEQVQRIMKQTSIMLKWCTCFLVCFCVFPRPCSTFPLQVTGSWAEAS